jgi:hypothetical protein
MELNQKHFADSQYGGHLSWLLAGAALGMGLMYLFDPAQGNRRRKVLGQKGKSYAGGGRDYGAKMARHLRNRARGVVAKIGAIGRGPVEVDDDVLVERVRSQAGRKLSHPRALHVSARDGEITLSGDILANEVDEVIERIERVPGVKAVRNHLEVHESAGRTPQLQGRGPAYLQ